MVRDYACSARGLCSAAVALEYGDHVRVTDAAGRVTEGDVIEVTRSDFKGRPVRHYMAGGKKAGLIVSVDHEGGLVAPYLMYCGKKADVVCIETGEPSDGGD